MIDRPVEILYREVEGPPKGSVKAVIDAYGELVDEGCLLIFGPSITDNAEPAKEAIEERFHVPAISFGRYQHRGWMGPGYLVARQLDPDGVTAHTVDRFGD